MGDAVTETLRRRATLHLVPIVNLDGAARGHLRGSASGLDLNRQWLDPNPQTAPEIAAILSAMDRTGVALSLDVHGDETLRHNFVDGCDSDPASSARQKAGVEAFKRELLRASPAFQTKVGYAPTYGGMEGGGMATRAIARRFGAVGLTLEMPFGDSVEAPDPRRGWSPPACREMGRACLAALAAILDEL
jgi:murein tripeptide amidase MpaA